MNLFEKIKHIFHSRFGGWIPPEPQDIRELIIDGVTYLISPFYKDEGKSTATDKVARLIEKESESA